MWLFKKRAGGNGLQKIFLIVSVGAYIFHFLITLFSGLEQYRLYPETDMGSYLLYLAQQTVVPLFFFGLAYVLNPRKLTQLGKLFEAALLAVMGMIVLGVAVEMVTQWNNLVYGDFMVLYSGAYMVTLVGYAALLVYLRQTKRWK